MQHNENGSLESYQRPSAISGLAQSARQKAHGSKQVLKSFMACYFYRVSFCNKVKEVTTGGEVSARGRCYRSVQNLIFNTRRTGTTGAN